MRYYTYAEHMKDKYGEKVYKIPINISVTCPNRDGNISFGGCSFCGEKGTGFENLSHELTVCEQLKKNIAYICNKYKANKFVAYFQNFTNTYLPLNQLLSYTKEACLENVVELSFSTRPDCISDEYIKALKELGNQYNKVINIELGLQTINYHTLRKINRGHSLAEFIDAVLRIKKAGFTVCTHIILNLPWDTQEDVIENAKVLSALSIDQVKLHALYIEKNTDLCDAYEKGELKIISLNNYVNRVVLFLEYLKSDIVIQRLIARAPKEDTIFCNWNTSWWKIKDKIEEQMNHLNTKQGKKCDYLDGKALKKFKGNAYERK